MNIALPALGIFLLALPGFIFVSTYYTLGSSRLRAPAFGVRTAMAVSVSMVLHALFGVLIVAVFAQQVDYALVFSILRAEHTFFSAENITSKLLVDIVVYMLSMYLVAGILGSLIRKIVVKLNLDRRILTERLRFTTDFAYIAAGRDFTNQDSDSQYVAVELICEIGMKLVLYTGLLSRVDYSNDGEPNRLYLSGVMAKEVDGVSDMNESINSNFKQGNYYVFNVKDLKLLGFTYGHFDESTSA